MSERSESEVVERLSHLARRVGSLVGWSLELRISDDGDLVALVVVLDGSRGARPCALLGPTKVSELGLQDVELELEALERGDRVLLRVGDRPFLVDPNVV